MEVIKEIKIVEASSADIKVICDLGVKTFIEAYKAQTSKKDMEIYNSLNFNEKKIAAEFEEENARFYLSYYNNVPVGYAKVRAKIKPEALKGIKNIEIQRTYVLKQYQKLNIGRRLIERCIEEAVSNNFQVVWLGVWDQNVKAIEFYKKMGFRIFGERNFPFGKEVHLNFLMKKELSNVN